MFHQHNVYPATEYGTRGGVGGRGNDGYISAIFATHERVTGRTVKGGSTPPLLTTNQKHKVKWNN